MIEVLEAELAANVTYTVQNPSQTVTSYHSGSVYGSGGYGSYSGTSSTTVPGRYTIHQIPYSVNRYDYGATFWAKSKPPSLGGQVNDLTDDLRREIGSNRGVVVNVVVKGSPARRERALIYKTLVLTGLRKGELASLTAGPLKLTAMASISQYYHERVLCHQLPGNPGRKAGE